MKPWNVLAATLCISLVPLLSTGTLQAQRDHGPRGGSAGAGSYYHTLNPNEQTFFNQALLRFQEVDSVSGTIEKGVGLGPTFQRQ
jgi:hypothetical protein